MDIACRSDVRGCPATLDRELSLIREAIAMVASGQSPRVIVASLRFGKRTA